MPLLYGLSWGSWTDMKGDTNCGPAACASVGGHDAVVARTGTDGNVYVNFHTDGKGFSGWTKVPATSAKGAAFTTNIEPCAGKVGGKLCLFAVAPDNTIYYNMYDGSTWSNWTEVSGAGETNRFVSLASNGALYMTGTDSLIWVNPKPTAGGSWSIVPGASPLGPAFLAGSGICTADFTYLKKTDQIGLFARGSDGDTSYYLFPDSSGYWNDLGAATNHGIAAAPQAPSSDAGSWIFMVGVHGYINYTGVTYPEYVSSWEEPAVTGSKIQTDAAVAVAAPLYLSGGDTSQKVFLFAKNSKNSSVWVNIAQVSFESFA